MSGPAPYAIEYEFSFDNGEVRRFALTIDPRTINFQRPANFTCPEWTRLEQSRCEGCRLLPERHSHCPVACNLAEMVMEFKDALSCTTCKVQVRVPERTYYKETAVQQGLFSLFGLVMATSGCPSLDMLRPMARFHLPFASVEETLVRTISMYLLRQYFLARQGATPDIDLSGLYDAYQEVQAVNRGILARIRHITAQDADRNALVILNNFAQILSMEWGDGMQSLAYLFTSSLDETGVISPSTTSRVKASPEDESAKQSAQRVIGGILDD